MKTINTLCSKALILVLVLIIFSGSRRPAKAADIRTAGRTVLTDIQGITRIEVSGNVELLLSQAVREQVEVYDRPQFAKNVRFDGGTLYVHSDEKLTILVSVNHLQSVRASGSAQLRSLNRLSSIDLDICLMDRARGSMEAEALNLNATLQGSARMDLSGQAENHTVRLSEAARLEAPDFEAASRSLTISDSAVASLGNTEVRTRIPAERFARS